MTSTGAGRVMAVMLQLVLRTGRLLKSHGTGNQVENTSEFWADVSMVVVSPVAIAAGFVKGA